jgi:hypothetical protein
VGEIAPSLEIRQPSPLSRQLLKILVFYQFWYASPSNTGGLCLKAPVVRGISLGYGTATATLCCKSAQNGPACHPGGAIFLRAAGLVLKKRALPRLSIGGLREIGFASFHSSRAHSEPSMSRKKAPIHVEPGLRITKTQ